MTAVQRISSWWTIKKVAGLKEVSEFADEAIMRKVDNELTTWAVISVAYESVSLCLII